MTEKPPYDDAVRSSELPTLSSSLSILASSASDVGITVTFVPTAPGVPLPLVVSEDALMFVTLHPHIHQFRLVVLLLS